MPYKKTIICLANSRKLNGRCVAGKIVAGPNTGNWLRPVATGTGELSPPNRRYQNGQEPQLLDIIEIEFIAPSQHAFQLENQLINPPFYWELKQRASWQDLSPLIDNPVATLWTNGSSTYNGRNDRIVDVNAPADVQAFGGSLKLIEVYDFKIHNITKWGGERGTRGSFTYSGSCYDITVTDPVFESYYANLTVGIYNVGHAILCLSLGEPYKGFVYKLIAGILIPPQTGNHI